MKIEKCWMANELKIANLETFELAKNYFAVLSEWGVIPSFGKEIIEHGFHIQAQVQK